MKVQDSSIIDVASSAFETVKGASLLIGRNVKDLTKMAYYTGSKIMKSVIAATKIIWASVQPLYAKLFAFLKSPAGIATMLTGWAGYCIRRADATDDKMAKIGMASLSVFSAFSAGLLTAAAYLK